MAFFVNDNRVYSIKKMLQWVIFFLLHHTGVISLFHTDVLVHHRYEASHPAPAFSLHLYLPGKRVIVLLRAVLLNLVDDSVRILKIDCCMKKCVLLRRLPLQVRRDEFSH